MAGMQLDLEAIVREVMRRLERELAADTPASAIAPGAASAGTGERPAAKSSPAALRVQDRVVTLARLKDRLPGIRQLIVPPGAVVTPSVRDELRKRKIQLQVASETSCPTKGPGANVLVAAAAGSYDAETVLKTIEAEAAGAQRVGSSSLVELVEQLCDRVARDGLPAVLLTTEPVAAVCLANRFGPLRAVWGAGVAAVQQGCQSIGANLLVLDPTAGSEHEIRSMVRQFLQGDHQCPPNWQPVLAGSNRR